MNNKEEIWKDIIGYEGLYQVSNCGNVRRLLSYVKNGNRLIKVNPSKITPRDNGKGYLRCKLSIMGKEKLFMLHRLIAIAFIPNPFNLKTINHIDGNKKNNSIGNLEWCTQSYNIKQEFVTGRRVLSEEYLKKRSDIMKKVPRKNGKWVKS